MKSLIKTGCWLLVVSLFIVRFESSPLSAGPAVADRAALVVRFGDGSYIVRLVPLAHGSVTGLEFLKLSGLPVADEYGMVCKIGPDGCDYPEERCICQMPNYWGYWHLLNDVWTYSSAGAAGFQVEPGSVEGWSWGNGPRPPKVSSAELFDDRRLAPGLPVVTPGLGSLTITLPAQGDVNDDANATAQYRSLQAGAVVRIVPLAHEQGAFTGLVGGLPQGQYQIDLGVFDPDGINGSVSWVLTATIVMQASALRLFVPYVESPETALPRLAPDRGCIACRDETRAGSSVSVRKPELLAPSGCTISQNAYTQRQGWLLYSEAQAGAPAH